VWILCDVYENDLANVHVGETAELRLNAYPDKTLNGRISNIGPILDPNIPHRESKGGSGQSAIADAGGDVCERYLSRTEEGEAGRGASRCHSAFA